MDIGQDIYETIQRNKEELLKSDDYKKEKDKAFFDEDNFLTYKTIKLYAEESGFKDNDMVIGFLSQLYQNWIWSRKYFMIDNFIRVQLPRQMRKDPSNIYGK